MKHEDIHERLALRLYGELEVEEARALDMHLESCEDCRRFARELEEGLGRIVHAKTASSFELPADWIERLRQVTQPSRTADHSHASRHPMPRISPWWTAAAGFAAGLVIALSALRVASDESAPRTPTNERSTYARYYGAATPPTAANGGQWSRLAAYRRR